MRMIEEVMNIYVGVDPSLNQPGLAVLDQDGNTLLATSLIVRRGVRGSQRLSTLSHWLSDMLKSCFSTQEVAGVAFEAPSLESTHREFDLGEASGALKQALFYRYPEEPTLVEPTRLKLFATGNGAAGKEDILHAVKKLYSLDLGSNNDAADAWWLARLAWSLDHSTLLKRRCEMEVVHKILHPKTKQRKITIPRNDI